MALTRLEHVLVLTQDIDRTRDFYRDALGLVEGDRPPLEFPGYWLYAGGVPCVHVADRDAYTAHSATTGIPASPPAESTGALDHLAFAGDDHDEALARLERAGVEPRHNTVPGIGMRQLFFEDPNGVKIEINVMPAEGGKEE
ncbi:MAG TPA: VOC family protein [Solirubrobacterales bacterium]|nr:VOC family protein [Solirubrobacterales bacterium]